MANSPTSDSIETEELIQLEMTISNDDDEAAASKEAEKPAKRRPPTFEAAFSQARSLPNHARVNYEQALISTNHSARADSLVLLPAPSSAENTAENNLHSLERLILNEQLHPLDLSLHDPASNFLTSLVDSEPSASSTELVFNPSISSPPPHHPPPQQQHSLSGSPPPQPPSPPPQPLLSPPASPTPFPEDPNSSPPGLYGSSPPAEPESPSPSPPAPKPISPPKKSAPPPRPPPLKLCLPSRPRRPAIETSQTPYNSPAGSNPSTPTLSTSNLRPITDQPANVLKRTIQASSSSATNHPPAAKKQKINPLFLSSNSSHSSPGPKIVSETDKLKVWKRIHLLRAQRDLHTQRTLSSSSKSSEELDRLEKLANTTPLSSAIELKNQAQEYVDMIQKIQDALGEELVRVQLEESVLRHVRGIIADRLVKNQEWNQQHS
ncbi:hypothetical protein PTTG_02593 [Puccinia triticina 1-1 BBBD Race 1]|uniref:Uncharacterized protein n=1 Tax=Puccinia triticina (isolate 1-1 / race 1 (BBBD)) TaxID=630390 RepID=A0A180GD12_PUCT1|nr:hypothetical protein PTTG_02593 [Puccinia triticina 1-1 BBBD Race 1]